MRLGFATDDDQETAPDGVVDGRADEREPSAHEVSELFMGMCEKLRAMGCIRVDAFGLSARFPVETGPARAQPSPAAVPVVTALPAEPKQQRKRKPEKGPADDVFPDQEGDTEEDRVRRRKYRDLATVIVGK